MRNRLGAGGALLTALAVMAGAFGAHGLQRLTADPAVLEPYKTSVQYMLWHGLALCMLWVGQHRFTQKELRVVTNCFTLGLLFFCGSLFLITLGKITGNPVRWLGPVTPVGGLFFIAGWLSLAWFIAAKKA